MLLCTVILSIRFLSLSVYEFEFVIDSLREREREKERDTHASTCGNSRDSRIQMLGKITNAKEGLRYIGLRNFSGVSLGRDLDNARMKIPVKELRV